MYPQHPSEHTDLSASQEQSLKTVGQISYALHAFVAVGAVLPGTQPGAFLLLLAFALDLFKRQEAQGSWQETHFRWRIHSVLWAGGLYLITAPLWVFIVPGWMAWALISLWFLYRVIRGWLALSEGHAVPMSRHSTLSRPTP